MDSWRYLSGDKEQKLDSENGRSSGLIVSEEECSSLAFDSSSIDLQLGSGEKRRRPSISSDDRKRGMLFCLVYGCRKDLSSSKEYYKKHKVCEIHSKTVKVIVNGIEQRFCQQCSRFHILAEFDNEKRSCRKRLAGHNARRRKPSLGSLNSLGRFQDYNGPWFEDSTSIPSILLQTSFLHQHKKYKVDDWNQTAPVEPNANLISSSQHFPFRPSKTGALKIDKINKLPIENDFLYQHMHKSSHNSSSSSFQVPPEQENSGCALYLLSNPPFKHPTTGVSNFTHLTTINIEENCLPPFPISNIADRVHNGVQGTMDCVIAHNHDLTMDLMELSSQLMHVKQQSQSPVEVNHNDASRHLRMA